MMKLIADSGSTKTDWMLIDNSEGDVENGWTQAYDGLTTVCVTTQGINPFHQESAAIYAILRDELLPLLQGVGDSSTDIREVYFYGSGVRPELEPVMCELLSRVFPMSKIEVHSDLLGAAIAVCGDRPGLACILGTGANSCLFDGRSIVANTPPLGYILGDEGSGAVLGARFLNALLKGFLQRSLRDEFFETFGMTEADVIARVYRQPLANRFLASLSPFVHRHIGDPDVNEIVVGNFRDFFRRNLTQYGRRDLPVGAVGSVAWHYRTQLVQAAEEEGYRVGNVLRSPLDGLMRRQ